MYFTLRCVACLAALAVASTTAFAQGQVEFRIVKLNAKGEVEISTARTEQVVQKVTVTRPVQVARIVNGQQQVETQYVTEERQEVRNVTTYAYLPLVEKDVRFTDLKGREVPLAQVKTMLEKSARAVISLPQGGVLPSGTILSALKDDSLVLWAINPQQSAPVLKK